MSMSAGSLGRVEPSPRIPRGVAGRVEPRAAIAALGAALALAALTALSTGAFPVGPREALVILAHAGGLWPAEGFDAQQQGVLLSIRLPRVLLGLAVGAALGGAGALMQGLFRNPLADPGLVGVSSGAALAAAAVIVLGVEFLPGFFKLFREYALPLSAFAGALAATLLVWRIAEVDGRSSLGVMLLAGIAVNALAVAGIGALSYVANDEQLRNLSFWSLGSLGGANAKVVAIVGIAAIAGLFAAFRLAAALDALALGEAQAAHLGIEVHRIKARVIVLAALLTGASVAFCGMIAFLGLLAPHMVRLACGPAHRLLLPASALLGALLLTVADLVARTAFAPAEMPVGVITALIGGPFFLLLLLRERRRWML